MTKISVIVPVYNARDYVVSCFESLVNQSMDEIEVIFVDDHGTDDSIETLKRKVDDYTGRIQFLFLETSSNSGPGSARNLGIEAAKGEYVAFVDSDDWIEADFCELLYKAASKKDADLAYCDIRIDNMRDGSSREMANPRVSGGEFTEKKHKYFLSRFVSFFTTFLYRRTFLVEKGLRFPSTRSSEDSCFLTSCIIAAERVASVPKPLYHYVQRRFSLSTGEDPEKYLQKLSSFDGLMDYATRNDLYPKYREELDFIYIKKAYLMAVATYVNNTAKPDSSLVSALYTNFVRRIPEYRKNRYFRKSVKLRLLTMLTARCPYLAVMILKKYQ